MTILEINGRRVEVDDSFRSLSPEQQQKTVEEISRQMGIGGGQGESDPILDSLKNAPVTDDDPWRNLMKGVGQKVDPATNQPPGVPEYVPPGVEGYDPKTGEVTKPDGGLWDQVGAFVTGAADLPVIGPALKPATAGISAAITAPFADDSFSERYGKMRERQEQVMAENPGSALAGNIAGTLLTLRGIPNNPTASTAFGLTGSVPQRMIMSGLTGSGINMADTAVRGGDAGDILNSGLIGGGIGLVLPGASHVANTVVRAIGDKAAPIINAVRDPAREASRRVGTALERDLAANPSQLMTTADEAVARQSGLPVLNVDRGGEVTRGLARSVANQSPEARQAIEKVASDRFATQGVRAVDFVKRLAGGNVDDLQFQNLIRETARNVNRPAYNKAFASPAAQNMWNESFEQLMQAPAMQAAARQATTRGANRAATEGFTPVRNPFTVDEATGRLVLAKNADGTIARPTLQFWDQTKRNLDSMIGKAQRSGDNTYAADLVALKNRLVTMLDEAVPEYQAARQGAAAFFGAEDAIEAGRKFANAPRSIPEFRAAYGKFNKTERAGFQAGFASELIDRIKTVGDRTNVINSVFKNQASREQIELVFGPQKAKELEAFIRVEDIADRLRGAMGGSTTTRQLVELGLGAMGGGYMTGDLSGAAMGALAVKGGRAAMQKADNAVMKRMAELLTKDDPNALRHAVNIARSNPAYMRALEAMGRALAVPSRAGAIVTGTEIAD